MTLMLSSFRLYSHPYSLATLSIDPAVLENVYCFIGLEADVSVLNYTGKNHFHSFFLQIKYI